MAGSVIRNYTIEIDKTHKKSIVNIYPHPVEILTPNGWENIKEEFEELQEKILDNSYKLTPEEEQAFQEYQQLAHKFYENKITSTIIFDTDDPTGIDIVGRDRVQHVLDAETREEISFCREFAYVYGASNISGTIILPYDDYSDVYVVSDADEDGVAELTYVKDKEETDGVRPYYEKANGQTYIYVDHFSGGGGTQADPYIVSNEQDLDDVRKKPGAWYLQDRDIVMGSFQSGEGFTPIGSSASYFTGVYDGNGYSIKSLYMNQDRDFVGLFGYTRAATIRNLRLIDPNITNKKAYTGALVGYGDYNVKIYNCNVISGVIEGQNGYVGGLIGYIYNTSGNTTINNSYNYNCTVRSAADIAGGFIGNMNLYSDRFDVVNCYSTGKVEDITVAKDRSKIGGFIGTTNRPDLFKNCYWDMQTSGIQISGTGIGKSTLELKTQSTFQDWDFTLYWHVNQDYNGGYPEHRQFIRYQSGSGTEQEPFLILNEFDLGQMRWFRNGSYFKFEDDIKMTEYQTGAGFYPISTTLEGKEQYFKGYVDGGGRCVANLFIYRPNDQMVSLFGYIAGGWIKNLDIVDCNITGNNYTATLVGQVSNSNISNCHIDTFSSCKVTSTANHGSGLVGLVTTNGIVEDCSVNVTVAGVNYVGIFAGYLNGNGIIRRCYASGKGENTGNWLGGFIGYTNSSTAVIEDCLTIAELNGTSVGGFGGSIQSCIIRRCIASGKAFASSSLNGFIYTGSGTFSDNYFDKELYKTTSSTGAVGLTTREMKYRGTYSNTAWNFDDIWILDPQYNNGYPSLRKLLPLDLPLLGFRNEFGKYYTDNAGERLRYLEFGTLVASQTSSPKPVWVQNNADFPINQLKTWVDPATVAEGMEIDLSNSDTPFLPAQELSFNGTMAKGSAAKFYVRIKSDIAVKTGGTFDLRAKASPV
ncbi:right-handed parallel beta-helix repeat-containing protein [Paenibacillus sp. FSL M7-0802]|uniref:right-handed parallel beta-helix repeat-containing protein n=1 Tax=Paenibacillus TaxID=44249 RepID=UPI0003D37F8E|nr:right-handed parallel beta-helix repeat-containing protein [Paenibacillus polymyxa]AHC19032.1 filamentous hemagglutinin [Paenibacillus polymyxa CR1]